MVLGFLALAATCAGGVPPAPQRSAATAAGHAVASLEADVAGVQAGQPLWLALRLDLEPHWHTYWRNPGDAGVAPRVTFELPAGFEQGPLLWPAPSSFNAGGLTSYGFDGTVRLLTRIKAPTPLQPSGTVHIAAHVQWLACREVCTLGKADVAIDLPIMSTPPQPSASSTALRATLAALPGSSSGLRARASRGAGSSVVLEFDSPERISRAVYYADEPLRIEPSAPQPLQRTTAAWTLTLQAGTAPAARLDGVLELFVEGRETPVAYTLSVPVEAQP